MVCDKRTQQYLSRLTGTIIQLNPALAPLAVRFLFHRAWWPNASSYGEGTLVFNIGLFSKLSNEGEVVFVLCHELAHLLLDHGNRAISKYVQTVYGEDFQEKLKALKKQEYEKNRDADKLIEKLTFSSLRHSRDHESEADSLALVFMRNTRFDPRAALSCLAALDTIDQCTVAFDQLLPRVFHCQEYPFRSRWLRKEETFFGVSPGEPSNSSTSDSLKTHPDCKDRIQRLEPAVRAEQSSGRILFLHSPDSFTLLQQQFREETIRWCLGRNRVSKALFLALQMYSSQGATAFNTAVIGDCMNRLYTHQQEHTLGKITDLPSPSFENQYNRLLEFLEKLSLEEMRQLTYHFLRRYEQQFAGNEDFAAALIRSKEHAGATGEKQQWLQYYQRTFSPPKYRF